MEYIVPVLAGLVSLITLMGLFVFIQIFAIRAKEPADTSNRINKFRLFWFALTRPDEFLDPSERSYTEISRRMKAKLVWKALMSPEIFVDRFKWLKNDELDNVSK